MFAASSVVGCSATDANGPRAPAESIAMSTLELKQGVLDLLRDFRGMAPLKELFWSELNFDRENRPLARRGWSDTARDALAEDPLLFASAG